MPRKDQSGQRFDRWEVLSISPNWHRNNQLWICRCDCGVEKHVAIGSLRSGRSKSCGCLSLEAHTIHSLSRTPTYNTWTTMVQRCTNPRNSNYPNYGGRGICVHPAWLTFAAFLADVGERPAGTSLDRIDNDRGYQPGNVRWATRHEQNRNSRACKLNVVAVCLIRHLRRRGALLEDLGHAFGVNAHHISVIASGLSWIDAFNQFPRGAAHPELAAAA